MHSPSLKFPLGLRSLVKRPRRGRNGKLTLTDLPTHIIQYIATFLPLASNIAFSLVSHGLHWTIGYENWHEIFHDQSEHHRFLTLLERDCKHLFMCPLCKILHRLNKFDAVRGTDWKGCRALESGIDLPDYRKITWLQIYLVSRWYIQRGDRGINIGALNTSGKHSTYSEPKNIIRFTSTAKIVGGEILIKFTYQVRVNAGAVECDLKICPHLKTRDYWRSVFDKNPLESVVSCRLKHLRSEKKSCARCTPMVRHCKSCMTEYDFTCMATKDGPQAVIEVWQNLGSGQDIDDPVWRAVELGYPVLEISESKHIRARYESNTLALNLIEGDRSESPPVQKDSVTHRVLHWLIYVIEGTI